MNSTKSAGQRKDTSKTKMPMKHDDNVHASMGGKMPKCGTKGMMK